MQGSRGQTHCKGYSKSSLASGHSRMTSSTPHRWGWSHENRCGTTCNQSTSPTAVAKTGAQHQLSTMVWSVCVPGFSLPRAQWCTLNWFRTGQGRRASCLKKWGLSSCQFCACGDTETYMSHIVEPCPINKPDSGILSLHSADETAAQWLNIPRVTHTTTTITSMRQNRITSPDWRRETTWYSLLTCQ